MKQPFDTVSDNLKKMREERSLSLDQLAEKTGVSKSMLRKIELGTSSPTIATIWKIANGLKVSFTALLRRQETAIEVQGFKDAQPLTGSNAHYRLYPLVPFSPEQPFETYFIEIDPDTVFEGEPHEGNVYEYLYVTDGKIQVRVKDQRFEVSKNEFIKFHADCPHEYKCLSSTTATAIMKINYSS